MADRLVASPRIPTSPRVRSFHEWKNLPPEQQAAMIHEWESWWQDSSPAAIAPSGISFVPLAVPEPTAPPDVSYKGPGNSRQQMREDAENELREANRIRNQGL